MLLLQRHKMASTAFYLLFDASLLSRVGLGCRPQVPVVELVGCHCQRSESCTNLCRQQGDTLRCNAYRLPMLSCCAQIICRVLQVVQQFTDTPCKGTNMGRAGNTGSFMSRKGDLHDRAVPVLYAAGAQLDNSEHGSSMPRWGSKTGPPLQPLFPPLLQHKGESGRCRHETHLLTVAPLILSLATQRGPFRGEAQTRQGLACAHASPDLPPSAALKVTVMLTTLPCSLTRCLQFPALALGHLVHLKIEHGQPCGRQPQQQDHQGDSTAMVPGKVVVPAARAAVATAATATCTPGSTTTSPPLSQEREGEEVNALLFISAGQTTLGRLPSSLQELRWPKREKAAAQAKEVP